MNLDEHMSKFALAGDKAPFNASMSTNTAMAKPSISKLKIEHVNIDA